MESFLSYSTISEYVNYLFEKLAVIALLAWLALTIIRYTYKNIAKEGLGRGLYMGVIAVIEGVILVFLIYYPFPQFLIFLSRATLTLAAIRWVMLFLIAFYWSHRVGREKSGWRGVRFVLFILTTVLFGWLYDHWLGIVFMSIPVLLIYLHMINKLAQVILPAANPDDKQESWKRTRIFLAYLLGVQHPIWMAKSRTGYEIDKLLDGSSNQIGKHGIIAIWSHQVAGISKGTGANRVDGPGVIFTNPFEAPVTLVDLRMQSRISEVHAVTKDGMEVPTVVFTAFAIDRRNTSPSQPFRHRHGIVGDFNIDHPEGSFPFSSGRVLAALRTAGIKTRRRNEDDVETKPDIAWDEWVVKQIHHVTRLVVAERSLDELWRPQTDRAGFSALTEIAQRLQDLLAPQLSECGINLITVRIVNFKFTDEDKIVQRNLKTWSSYWNQRIAEANADIEIMYREEVEKAHAYSKSILLGAIAESITKARLINEALPRHVIAQYYIHALEEYMKGEPGLNMSESKKRLETVREILMNSRMEDE
jgi:hypothetical protein